MSDLLLQVAPVLPFLVGFLWSAACCCDSNDPIDVTDCITHCASNLAAEQYTVTGTGFGTTSGQTCCASMNGSFVVTYRGPGTCQWRYIDSDIAITLYYPVISNGMGGFTYSRQIVADYECLTAGINGLAHRYRKTALPVGDDCVAGAWTLSTVDGNPRACSGGRPTTVEVATV